MVDVEKPVCDDELMTHVVVGDDEETKRLKLKVTLESAAVDKHDENSNASSKIPIRCR